MWSLVLQVVQKKKKVEHGLSLQEIPQYSQKGK